MKAAWQEEYKEYYPNFKSNISPKQLEHFLSLDNRFEKLSYFGQGSFDKLNNIFKKHLSRLKDKKDFNSQIKYKNLTYVHDKILTQINERTHI